LASKCVLAARIDSFFEDATGSKGREMREEVERKVRKWQEPPPPKKKRALPVPNDKPRKKRGGKKSLYSFTHFLSIFVQDIMMMLVSRYRKFRERYQVTEVQKQKNRMVIHHYTDTPSFSLSLPLCC
jgi:U4/U6 small nuclear ribonucleoprotein PRP31